MLFIFLNSVKRGAFFFFAEFEECSHFLRFEILSSYKKMMNFILTPCVHRDNTIRLANKTYFTPTTVSTPTFNQPVKLSGSRFVIISFARTIIFVKQGKRQKLTFNFNTVTKHTEPILCLIILLLSFYILLVITLLVIIKHKHAISSSWRDHRFSFSNMTFF